MGPGLKMQQFLGLTPALLHKHDWLNQWAKEIFPEHKCLSIGSSTFSGLSVIKHIIFSRPVAEEYVRLLVAWEL